MSRLSRNIDRYRVLFDESSLVANAGLMLVSTLMVRLGLEDLINETVRLRGRVGGANPGRKVLTLVATLMAGGSHIDHADMLRAGDTGGVLPFRVVAPSTLGTFLRSFTFGHVKQLDRVISETLKRVWGLGIGPGGDRLVLDLDSTVCEVFGDQKQGVSYSYTGKEGYHPLVASRAGSGEILHARFREGSSQKGHRQFVRELIGRVRRAGATGEILLRADSGFWSRRLIDALEKLGVKYSVTVKINPRIAEAIGSIPEESWTPISSPDDGKEEAEVSEMSYVSKGATGKRHPQKTFRMIVRRTRPTGTNQLSLFGEWRHHAFVTNRNEPAAHVDREHRQHATVELNIRDLKEGSGLSHLPSGVFPANGAWLATAVLAHNLIRWTTQLGDTNHQGLCVAATFRTRLVALPGRIVNLSGQPTLRLPTNWPWKEQFNRSLTRLRALPQLC